MRVLAGDIGGTNARLAIVELGDTARIVAEQTTPSQDIRELAATIEGFLAANAPRPTRACLGLAGPVRNGQVTGTNLPWMVDARALGQALGIPALALINDFEAAGHGIAGLRESDFLTLQAGEPDPCGTIALIGAGTGLGEGFLVRVGPDHHVLPSEGGHATFAAQDAQGWALFNYLSARHGHVSWERVVSGPGLVEIFEFLAQGRPDAASALRERMARGDAAAAISEAGVGGSDPLAVQALALFIDGFGAEAGNLALTVLATGGLYVAGGIARRLAPKFAEGAFLTAFRRKGRMAALLQRIPVRVVLNGDVGLIGAALVAASQSGGTPCSSA